MTPVPIRRDALALGVALWSTTAIAAPDTAFVNGKVYTADAADRVAMYSR